MKRALLSFSNLNQIASCTSKLINSSEYFLCHGRIRRYYTFGIQKSFIESNKMSERGLDQPWISRRSPVYSTKGIVSCSQPLAAQAGIRILEAGGNAADAAVAVAAALNVTQPSSTGLGGDVFCLYFDSKTKEVQGLNASGRCPKDLSIDVFEKLGYSESNRPPSTSPLFITVPGAASGWCDSLELFGSKRLSLSQILEPAIRLAEDGYPVGQIIGNDWARSERLIQTASPNGGEMLLDGRAPREGEIMKMPYLAQTFRELATSGKDGFYNGRIGEEIVKVVTQMGGIMSMEDLRVHVSTQDSVISTNYRGVDIFEMPPNGQGITALLALNILEGFDLSTLEHNSAQHLHFVIESLRLAFSDTRYFVADPAFVEIPVQGLLEKGYADERRKLINPNMAIPNIEHGFPPNSSCTVYFCVVDGEGNACSFINSNYQGFGTAIVPSKCGFTLQNRGANFSLDRNSANSLQPGKRPYHTIIPGMAVKDGELYCPFGVMGGFMQPQGHLQVISNMVDFGMNPQEALDASRVQIDDGTSGGRILLEEGIRPDVRERLLEMGHNDPVFLTGWERVNFGMGQIIRRDPQTGVLCAGSDPRCDGHAVPLV